MKEVLWPAGNSLHVPTYHKLFVIPVLIGIVITTCFYKHLSMQGKQLLVVSLVVAVLLVVIALAYGFLCTEWVADFQNRQQGILHYFSMKRINWVCPTLWYFELGIVVALIWELLKKYPVGSAALLVLVVLPTVYTILYSSYFYLQINQKNNGSDITGYLTWESYFAEDVMQDIEDAIGEDILSYRIVHLGMNPTPSLVHGFYTVDGYSNNYPLEYNLHSIILNLRKMCECE